MLKHFTRGAPPAGLQMLNALVDEANDNNNCIGDGQFIFVYPGSGVKQWVLDIDAVLRLVPRTPFFPTTHFAVLVKTNGGSDGSSTTFASWTYDLYDVDDTGYTNALNLAGALQPLRSAARVAKQSVTQAADGSYGVAFYAADGAIRLWDCPETNPTTVCS